MSIKEKVLKSAPKSGAVHFIAVDGHGGSGKSTFAKLLGEQLEATVIHTDDFASWDNPKDWWPRVIDDVFEPIEKGATTLDYERSKWWEDHHPTPVVGQPVTPIMILEGVSSSRKEFAKYISLSIYVDTPKEVCLQRGFERDKGQDGKSDQEIRDIWAEWYEDEEKFYEQDGAKDRAEVVINGTDSFEKQIG